MAKTEATRDGENSSATSLELLWGKKERSNRGPRPELTLKRIVEAAIDLADRDGLPALSMRRVADELGSGTMSLYRYVPGKDELVEVMTDHAIGDPPDLDEALGWRLALQVWAEANFEVYHRHPWLLFVVTTHPPQGPNRLTWLEAALTPLGRNGLPVETFLPIVALLDRYVRSAAQSLFESGGKQHGEDRIQQMLKRALEQDNRERFPMLLHVQEAGMFEGRSGSLQNDAQFGLQRVLDGIESFIARQKS